MENNDTLQRFIFENSNIRGELAHLNASYQTILSQQDYPPAVQHYLGQALVISALLTATIKIEGSLTLQIRTDGPISLLVVQCNHDFHLRGLAQWDKQQSIEKNFQQAFGQGHLVISIEPDQGKPYQGIIPINSDINSLAQAIEHYFSQSEQLATKVWLASDTQQAAGLLLQHLPHKDYTEEEFWTHLATISTTLRDEELLELDNQQLLYRLYHEETVRLFDPEPVCFRCRCDQQKMAQALLVLGETEIRDILQEQGKIGIDCQYCSSHYDFDEVDVEQLLTAGSADKPSQTRH